MSNASVSSLVTCDFVIPPITIVFWCRIAARAAVPKAAIHEYCQLQLGNNQIWRPRQTLNISSKFQFSNSKHPARAPLNACSLGTDVAHVFRHGLGLWLWSRVANDAIFAQVQIKFESGVNVLGAITPRLKDETATHPCATVGEC